MMQTLVVPDPLADLARLEGVPSAIAAAVAAVDVVLRDRGPRPVSGEVRAAALAASATASAELTDDPAGWLVGSLRLSAELASLAPLVQLAPGQVLARAHAVVARGKVPDDDLGRVVGGPDVSARLRGLSDLLTSSTGASAIVLAAVAHAEIATVLPFAAGSGLVARAVEHLVLMSAGLDPQGVIVVEAGHQMSGAAYARGLAAYADARPGGVKDWLLHCTRALSYGAEVSPLRSRPGGGGGRGVEGPGT
jgi:hypothetical protein